LQFHKAEVPPQTNFQAQHRDRCQVLKVRCKLREKLTIQIQTMMSGVVMEVHYFKETKELMQRIMRQIKYLIK
jgi:hypothetical protein